MQINVKMAVVVVIGTILMTSVANAQTHPSCTGGVYDMNFSATASTCWNAEVAAVNTSTNHVLRTCAAGSVGHPWYVTGVSNTGSCTHSFDLHYECVCGIAGDADLDGDVDDADFRRLDRNFGRSPASWSHGDFNGNNVVDFSDFLLLSQNHGTHYSPWN